MEEEKRSLSKDCEFQREVDNEMTLNIVEKQMIDISHILHFWGDKCAKYREYVKNAQLNLDVWMAQKRHEVLEKKVLAMDAKEGSRFKRDISSIASKELVILNFTDDYKRMLSDIYESEKRLEELEKALKAIDTKSFMLGQIANTLRKEWSVVK